MLPITTESTLDKNVWQIYNERADIADRELMRDWNDSLNTLLIFGALYTAVLTAFIIESMKLLQEDMGESTRNILFIVSHQLANASTPAFEHAEFTPEAWAVRVNYYFFTSISCSLVAALGAVLALQWVGSYDFGLIRSSAKVHATQRQLRYNGIKKWKLVHLISALPLLIHISLFLFFVGLVDWLWHIHRRVAYVVVTGLVIAGILYAVTHIISIFDVSAPFRTPISRSLPYMIRKVHSYTFLTVSHLSVWIEDKVLQQLHSSRESVDESPGIQRFMKYQAVKLQKFWLNIRSLVYALHKFVINPTEARSFEHRERQALDLVTTLQRDTILWLAKNIEDLPSSRPAFVTLLKEAVRLPHVQLIDPRMNLAPWSAIFQNVFQKFNEIEDVTLEAVSSEEFAELEALLEAAALVGTNATLGGGVSDRNIRHLCSRIHECAFGRVSTFAQLVQWKFQEFPVWWDDTPLSNVLRQEPDLILNLSNSWIYMVLYHIHSHVDRLNTQDLVEFLSPLASSKHYEGEHRLLEIPTIFIIMRIVTCIQGYDTYPGSLWEQYRQASSVILRTRSDNSDVLQTCHKVILLQLLSHAPNTPDMREEVLNSLLQAWHQFPSSDDIRPVILKLLADLFDLEEMSLNTQLMGLLAAVISWPEPTSTLTPARRWADIIEGCDQILTHEHDSRFTLSLLVSPVLRAAKAAGYSVQSPNGITLNSLEHPVILILASLILPGCCSLSPLKGMILSPEIHEDPILPDLLDAWCNAYRRPSDGDVEAECILLVESAELLPANLLTRYIDRQRDDGAYWEALVSQHLQRLLSNRMAPYILKQVRYTSIFPDCFFEAGGITWVATRLRVPNYVTERDDMVELIIQCIEKSTSVATFRNSLHLVATYIEVTAPVEAAPLSYGLFEEILTEIHTFRAAYQIHLRLRCSPFMYSLVTNGLEDQLKGEVETIIAACKRKYLLSPPVDDRLRFMRDPDELCHRSWT